MPTHNKSAEDDFKIIMTKREIAYYEHFSICRNVFKSPTIEASESALHGKELTLSDTSAADGF